MGIRGLMTYMNRNPDFLQPYELHGGYLVIDGHSLAAQLYISSRCNCAFGGDYDVYARAVAEFFDDFDKCQVAPLVILDGGTESKKMKTMYSRMEDKLQSASRYTPASQSQLKLMPLNIMTVFSDVLRQKGVRQVRTVLEADADIAGVAKFLKCPVLSYDSDFYIFGTDYIPINTLEPFPVRKGQVYVKRCKIFRVERFSKVFPGLDPSVLPLAAILLGNDYVDSKVFKHFFNCLKLSGQNQRLYNEGQRRIDTTFRWLKNYNLNDAVTAVLSKMPKKRRQKVLDIMELIVNGYSCLPCEMLRALGFVKEYELATGARSQWRKFKFEGDVGTLESRQLWRNDKVVVTDAGSSSDEEPEVEDNCDLASDVRNSTDECETTFDDTWPDWFAERHRIANFQAYFVDMMRLRLFTVPVQIEDFKRPSAHAMSLKIVGVIDGLLVAGREESAIGLSQIIREENKFVRRRVDTVRATESTKLPALRDLRDAPMAVRRRIFDDTLEIANKQSLIDELPPEWRVYVAVVTYWMRQPDEPSRNSSHMHAVLFTMMLSVVDKKIGYHRSLNNYNRLHKTGVEKILAERKRKSCATGNEKEESIEEALKNVTEEDCLVAAPFFISNCTMDRQLIECPRKFNAAIVHAFSQFQACLRHAGHLNVLLGFPYDGLIISNFYNGTMLYNLYTNLKTRTDAGTYIAVTLANSPSLLRVYNLLSDTVKKIVEMPIVVARKDETAKKRRKKKRTNDDDVDGHCPTEDDGQCGETPPNYSDPQNSFSVLGSST